MPAYQYIYVMKGLGKTYPGGREVLKDIWLSFLPGAKIGVLGANGAGKSTLLRTMAGVERDFVGEAWAADGVRVGYLPQEPALDPERDVFGNVVEGLAETKALVDRFEMVSACLALDLAADEMDRLIAEQAELQEQIDLLAPGDSELVHGFIEGRQLPEPVTDQFVRALNQIFERFEIRRMSRDELWKELFPESAASTPGDIRNRLDLLLGRLSKGIAEDKLRIVPTAAAEQDSS